MSMCALSWILLACTAHALCVLGLLLIFEFGIFEPDLVPNHGLSAGKSPTKDNQDDKEAEALLMKRG